MFQRWKLLMSRAVMKPSGQGSGVDGMCVPPRRPAPIDVMAPRMERLGRCKRKTNT